jgi:hypothetical protein
MFCPICGARTVVSEKRGPYRDRRCTNADCRLDFTTREELLPQRHARLCARTRALHGGVLPLPLAIGGGTASTSDSGLAAPSDPMESMRAVPGEQQYRQAEGAA